MTIEEARAYWEELKACMPVISQEFNQGEGVSDAINNAHAHGYISDEHVRVFYMNQCYSSVVLRHLIAVNS